MCPVFRIVHGDVLGLIFLEVVYTSSDSADQFDAFIGEVDLSFFIKFAGGHFEGFFAHAEEGVDGFGVGLVVIGELAFVFLQQAEDFGCGVFYAVIAGAAGGDVDLCLAGRGLGGGEDIFYKAGEAVADFYVTVDFIKWRTPVCRLLMMTT
jgi:hypothetical protein